MSQAQPRQQSGLNDMQMLQRHIMFKQLQELQRQQQLQELGDARQQSYINQISATNRQATGGQFPPLINGTPVHDASQMFTVGNMNLVQRGASPVVQRVQNGVVYSQAQSQALHSMGLVPQQLDLSLYGTPIGSVRNNLIQFSHLQGISRDSANMFTKGGDNHVEKPLAKSPAFSNSFLGDNCNVSSDQLCMPDGAFISKEVLQGKNLFGKVPIQGLNSGIMPENFHQVNTLQRNASGQEFSGRQERAGWPGPFQGKTTKLGTSQGLATLDQLEQKILFDMDDNSWDASFGRQADMGTGGFGNTLESTDYLNSLPSIQSGSWSALMQSAVAEASSSDTGLQEEWSGLSFQNTDLSTDNQPPNFVDSGKKQAGWVDNNLQSASSISSKPQILFHDSNMSSIFPSFQQSGVQFPIKQQEGMHSNSSHESIHQSPRNAGKWVDCNPQQKQQVEGSQPVQTTLFLENEWHGQNYMHPENDAHLQSMSSYDSGVEPCNRLLGRIMESPSPGGNALRNVCDNENAVNKFCAGDINGIMYKKKDSDSCQWKTENNVVASSFSNSVDRLGWLKAGTDDKIVGREDSQLNDVADVPNSIMTKIDQETGRHVSESHQLDFMQHDVSVKNKGNANMGADQQHQLHNSRQVLVNSYKGAGEIYDKQWDCYHSNALQHSIMGHELRENDSQLVAGSNQMSSGQGLCEQASQGSNNQEKGYFGQFKFIRNVSSGAMGFEKGHFPDSRKNPKDEVPPRGNDGANLLTSRSVSFYGPNVTVQPSQNMLKLLHKVDHDREHSTVTHLSSSDSNPLLEVPGAETPDASATQKYDHSSASQRFGLKLAPPSQQSLNPNNLFSFWNSPQMGNSIVASPPGLPYLRNHLQRQQLPAASLASQSLQATLPGVVGRLPNFNHLTSQDTSHPIGTNPFGKQFPILEAIAVSQPSVMSGMSEQVGFSIRPPGEWTNVSTQMHLPGTEPHRAASSLLLSSELTNNSLETTWTPHELYGQNSSRGTGSREFGACSMNSQGFDYGLEQPGNEMCQQKISLEMVDPTLESGAFSHQQESIAKHLPELNAVGSSSFIARLHQQDFDRASHGDNQSPVVSARDLEAFGLSLKPSHVLHQNNSLLSQVHSVKNVEIDPSLKVSEKYNGTDPDLKLQQVTAVSRHQLMHGHGVENPASSELNAASRLSSSPSRDIKVNFSSKVREHQSFKDLSQPLLQDTPQKMVTLGQSYSESHSSSSNVASNRTELSQISLQMTPSWFKHYGPSKNGQLLPMYDAEAVKNYVQQFPLGKSYENLHTNASMVQVNAGDASQVTSIWPTVATNLSGGKHSPPYLLPAEVTDQNLAVVKPKKRKIATFELLPWHKELTQGSQRLENISTAELEWAQAANRLIEKVEDEAEDVQPMLRPKKRLILTTQLMQQVFQPASPAILLADAAANYDSVVYFAARSTLGDACSLISCSRSDSHLSSNTNDLILAKPKTFERFGEQYFSKIVEDFTSRAKKLETDFLRLDKRASILDIRVDSQELEKYSVINRFVRFHSRGQADAAEASPSSGTAPTILKTFPQKYVTALPMPRAIPEGTQYLSL